MVSTSRNPRGRDGVRDGGEAVGAPIEKLARRLIRDEAGATAIEYGLVASMIFLVILGSLTVLSPQVRGLYESVLAMF